MTASGAGASLTMRHCALRLEGAGTTCGLLATVGAQVQLESCTVFGDTLVQEGGGEPGTLASCEAMLLVALSHTVRSAQIWPNTCREH